jgi:hypothetical protein
MLVVMLDVAPAFAELAQVVMGLGSRGACHRARIRATRWLGRDDEGIHTGGLTTVSARPIWRSRRKI